MAQNIQTIILVGLWRADQLEVPICLQRCVVWAKSFRRGSKEAMGGGNEQGEGDQVEMLGKGNDCKGSARILCALVGMTLLTLQATLLATRIRERA